MKKLTIVITMLICANVQANSNDDDVICIKDEFLKQDYMILGFTFRAPKLWCYSMSDYMASSFDLANHPDGVTKFDGYDKPLLTY